MQRQSPESAADTDGDSDEQMAGVGQRDETSQMIKNLVRYALACEYSRTPIRRDGIKDRGTRPSSSRPGRSVLADFPQCWVRTGEISKKYSLAHRSSYKRYLAWRW